MQLKALVPKDTLKNMRRQVSDAIIVLVEDLCSKKIENTYDLMVQ